MSLIDSELSWNYTTNKFMQWKEFQEVIELISFTFTTKAAVYCLWTNLNDKQRKISQKICFSSSWQNMLENPQFQRNMRVGNEMDDRVNGNSKTILNQELIQQSYFDVKLLRSFDKNMWTRLSSTWFFVELVLSCTRPAAKPSGKHGHNIPKCVDCYLTGRIISNLRKWVITVTHNWELLDVTVNSPLIAFYVPNSDPKFQKLSQACHVNY